MAIQPGQPQSIGGVLDTSFQLYKSSMGVVWPLCLLLILAGSPPTLYLLSQGGTALVSTDPNAMFVLMTRPGYWLVNVLSMLLSLWVLGALFLKMNAIGAGTDLGNGAVLQAAVRRAPGMLILSLLFVIAILIGLVLLIVPGLILGGSLILGWTVLMLEGKGPVAALADSHRLVWGNWWRTAAILTVGFIVLCVIYFAVAALVGVVLPLMTLGLEDLLLYSLVSTLLIGIVINLLVTPYYVALLLAIYWDLKLRKEGGDLAARVSALGAA